jgi:hypothetical protein
MHQYEIETIREDYSKDGQLYRLRGNSDYFREKYGTSNPHFVISCEDIEAWEGGWQEWDIPVCTIYGWRNGVELLPVEGRVYYGYIICAPLTEGSDSIMLGELVHESELEPVGWESLAPASSENITFENLDPGLWR